MKNLKLCALLVAALCILNTVSASTLSEISKETTALVKNASPAVVELQVERQSSVAAMLDLPRPTPGKEPSKSDFGAYFAKPGEKKTAKSVGSGFVIDPAGYILTTAHVVQGAENVTVRFSDGTSVSGKVTGTDDVTNAAVVKVEKTGLKALDLGNSDTLEPGALVVSINNQAGMEGTASLGMVSGTNRQLAEGGDLIQISGAIGPGASGGPVLDASGKVVGVTSAMLSPSSSVLPFNMPNIELRTIPDSVGKLLESIPGCEEAAKQVADAKRSVERSSADQQFLRSMESLGVGKDAVAAMYAKIAPSVAAGLLGAAREVTRTSGSTGFAIPINRLKPILDDLKSGREIERGYLGAMLAPKDGRVLFVKVESGSAAEQAGIKPGDVLVKADGRTFDSVQDFSGYVSSRKPGDVVVLDLERAGKQVQVEAKLGKRPEPAKISALKSPAVVRTTGAFPISLTDAGITEVAKALSDASGANIVVTEPEKIKKKVTINLKSTTVDKALDVICRAMGCAYKKDGDTYVISPR